jgi:pimeloyl-ACP methyl ester carboxylesterase/mannose-6-phosphate isomerase-like protein (cupin superfamily)
MKVLITGPADGEVVVSGPVRMRILEDGSATSHRLGIGEITIAPHTEGPPQHRHAEHDEGFYVVSGTARFTVGDTSYDAQAGTLVMVPPGAPHTFANASDEPAVLLNTFTPDLYVQYFRDLKDLAATGQPVTGAEITSVMARYATSPGDSYEVTVEVDGIGKVPVTYSDHGEGRTYVVLHGGAGPVSVAGFADQLAAAGPARVIVPVHPGFGGTDRPDGLDSPASLAKVYAGLLDELDLGEVTVIGNSIGGWIAAELALLGSSRLSGVILVDGVGIDVPDHPVADFFSLTLEQVADYSYHDPGKFRIDLAAMSPAQQAAMAGNRAALAVYSSAGMTDPGLSERLSAVSVPVLVLWGESDRIVDPDYGRAFAAAIPGAEFRLLPATGHVPQLETPAQLLAAVQSFGPVVQRGPAVPLP